jgi:hypothetical protein
MELRGRRLTCLAACTALVLFGGVVGAQDTQSAQMPPSSAASAPATNPTSDVIRKQLSDQDKRIDAMRGQIDAQVTQLNALREELAQQEADYKALRHAVGTRELDEQRGGGLNVAGASTLPMSSGGDIAGASGAGSPQVGQAPPDDGRPPPVAPIFDQPGVLTPKHKIVIEPSYQFGYSSADQVDLIGYTIIPAILIGLIDLREVKTETQTAALTARYGITNRLELEVRVPYVDSHTDTVSREIFTGTAQDNVFGSSGKGLGDIEATVRYQFNDGSADKPYYIGWLRFKSRTGTDPFEVTTDCVTRCVQNVTGTGLPLQLPTGSGFYSLQPGLTWLFPSDPVVFFGNLSYLYNFERTDVSRNLILAGREFLGTVKVGNVADASIGMGFALNDKASFSLGYDASMIGVTRENGIKLPGSTKIWLGTLLIGGSYRYNEKRTLNFTLGVGVTRDTPDATVTVRVPMTY